MLKWWRHVGEHRRIFTFTAMVQLSPGPASARCRRAEDRNGSRCSQTSRTGLSLSEVSKTRISRREANRSRSAVFVARLEIKVGRAVDLVQLPRIFLSGGVPGIAPCRRVPVGKVGIHSQEVAHGIALDQAMGSPDVVRLSVGRLALHGEADLRAPEGRKVGLHGRARQHVLVVRMSKLQGKTALITGGSTGIGLATAKRFAAEGARVVITGRRQAELDEAVEAIGSEALGVQGDVANLDDLDRLFATVRAQMGHLDILFANAGLGGMAPLGQITEAQFDLIFDVNVKGTLFTVQKALPLMKEGGSIILTGSTTGSTGTPAFSVYSATKAAVRNFARSWSLDLKATGLRVNVLSPGATATPGLLNGLARTGQQEAMVAGLIEKTPLGRLGRPEETAAMALFLASGDSSFMTGSEVFVDGGSAQI
jgi:NAD(P)-dependent dehydrogenase (short-subunit alcohol dehydrogenase family)